MEGMKRNGYGLIKEEITGINLLRQVSKSLILKSLKIIDLMNCILLRIGQVVQEKEAAKMTQAAFGSSL